MAIDFSCSNGNQMLFSSNHYLDKLKDNQYQIAMRIIGEILLDYSQEELISVFGFGAKLSGK
jgi:hypothetical protein